MQVKIDSANNLVLLIKNINQTYRRGINLILDETIMKNSKSRQSPFPTISTSTNPSHHRQPPFLDKLNATTYLIFVEDFMDFKYSHPRVVPKIQFLLSNSVLTMLATMYPFVSRDAFFAFSQDSMLELLRVTVVPEDRREFLQQLGSSTTFPSLSAGFKLSSKTLSTFLNAIDDYTKHFRTIFSFLCREINDRFQPPKCKHLIKIFLSNIPFNFGYNVLSQCKPMEYYSTIDEFIHHFSYIIRQYSTVIEKQLQKEEKVKDSSSSPPVQQQLELPIASNAAQCSSVDVSLSCASSNEIESPVSPIISPADTDISAFAQCSTPPSAQVSCPPTTPNINSTPLSMPAMVFHHLPCVSFGHCSVFNVNVVREQVCNTLGAVIRPPPDPPPMDSVLILL